MIPEFCEVFIFSLLRMRLLIVPVMLLFASSIALSKRIATFPKPSSCSINIPSMSASSPAAVSSRPLNVLGTELKICCTSPKTGFYRDGFCQTDTRDVGRHTVCARVTAEFLTFSKSKGNDLTTPVPQYQFPGLRPGDKWCLCVGRWKEALENDVAPPVELEACHIKALDIVTIEQLKSHAL